MNDWNNPEQRLRSWTPRGPSERIKAGLFAGPTQPSNTRAWNGHPTWHWLAPAMAMFVLGLFIAGRGPANITGTSGVLAEFSIREPERASFYANNSVQVTSFDWTNRGHSLTTPPLVSPTNS